METLPEETPAEKTGATAKVTPESLAKRQWTFDELVQQIFCKTPNRLLCPVCDKQARILQDNKTATGTTPNGNNSICLFFKHEKALVQKANDNMRYPEDKYKGNEEQGARLACYKEWTKLEHGILGRRRRKPLPVCVEARIKLMNPSDSFKGFQETNRAEKDFSSDEDTWEASMWNSPKRPIKKTKTE